MKSKQIEEVVSLFMALLLFLLPACTQTQTTVIGDGCSGSESSIEETVTETSMEAEELSPGLPAVDYDGYNFSILTTDIRANETAYHEVFTEGINGEAVNDAVYKRNLLVGEKYNIEIKGVYTGLFDYSTFEKSVASGDPLYDVVMTNQKSSVTYASKGYLQEITAIEQFDFAKPWWLMESVSETAINGKNFFAIGDMNLASWESTPVIFYNKNMAEKYSVGNLYEVVDSGKWTYDQMLKLCRDVSSDLNGNGEFDEDDNYGLALNSFSVFTMTYGGGFHLTDRDENGIPRVHITEAFLTYMQKHIHECNTNDSILNGDKIGNGDVLKGVAIRKKAFQENRVLFYNEMLTMSSSLREMETDFGVIPMPKRDESQSQYYSFFHKSNSSTIAVPITSTDCDMIGSVIEDMQYQSHLLVRPAYMTTTVKGKTMRDLESERMLDLILTNIIFDIVLEPGILDSIRPLFNEGSNALKSTLDSKMQLYEKTLQNYIDAFR